MRRIYRWEYFWLALLVIALLVTHFVIITKPATPIFDEQHYVTDAKLILQLKPTERAEHPPLGKLFIAAGIFIFGDNPLGWRFFSVIFGTISIVLFYLICRQLNMSRRTSYLATFLLALENLTFVQASVAMLDVFSLTFALASFLFYLKDRYVLSGIWGGLSALAKLYGALVFPAIALHWLFTKRPRSWKFLALVLTAPLSFLLFMIPLDYVASRQLIDPISRIKTMMSLSGSLTFTTASHDAASRPWMWVLRPDLMAYWYDPHYNATISFTIWLLIIPAAAYMVYLAVKKRDEAGLFGAAWFTGTYLVWIPASLVTNRISWVFYFYPTVGAICIGIALMLSRLLDLRETRKTGKLRWLAIIVPIFLILHIGVFVLLTPVIFPTWPSWYEISQKISQVSQSFFKK